MDDVEGSLKDFKVGEEVWNVEGTSVVPSNSDREVSVLSVVLLKAEDEDIREYMLGVGLVVVVVVVVVVLVLEVEERESRLRVERDVTSPLDASCREGSDLVSVLSTSLSLTSSSSSSSFASPVIVSFSFLRKRSLFL